MLYKRLIRLAGFLSLLLVGCSEDKLQDVTYLDDLFYLRNDRADMPVAVQGNLGSRKLLLFLQGGPSGGAQALSYARTFNRLEQRYAIAYWDQRATGEAKGSFPSTYLNRAQYVDDLDKLITLLKYRYGEDISIFLMGISWGGMLGNTYLIQHPEEESIKGWIEINGGHSFPLIRKASPQLVVEIADEQITAGNSVSEWERLKAVALDFDTTNTAFDYLIDYFQQVFDAEYLLVKDGVVIEEDEFGELEGKLLNVPFNLLTTTFGDLLFQANNFVNKALIEDTFVPDNFDKITVPTLLLWGAYDMRTPPVLGEQALEKLGTPEEDKRLVIFEESYHPLVTNEPEKFYNEVTTFIDQYP
ncbi:MAG: alpha/beta fold hydrolase [Thermonemataceae bacterium]